MADNTIKFRLLVEDKVSSGLAKVADTFDRLGGKGSSASLFGNVGAKAVAVGFGLIDQAAGAVGRTLGDAVVGAVKVEEATARLTTSLKANVPAWDGNTAAIDRSTEAGVRLGFTNAEQRDSLALLVAATHDVNKALQVQHVAMDLARFKSIDLQTATEALTRVEGGSFRILKSLGIQLKAHATAQDALNAVEAVAAGQCDAFVTTVGGKMVRAQTEFNDVMERLGEKILPAVNQGLDLFNVTLDILTSGKVAGTKAQLLDLQQSLIDIARTAAGPLHNALIDGWLKDQQALHDAGQKATESLDGILGGINPLVPALNSLGDAATSTASGIGSSWDDLVTKLKTDSGDIIDRAFKPIIDWNQTLLNDTKIKNAQRVLDNKHSSAMDRAQARIDIATAESDNAHLLVTLAERGQLTHSQIQTSMKELAREIKHATGPARAELQGIYDDLKRIDSLKQLDIFIRIHGFQGGFKGGARAAGGPVMAGETYTVGEHGTETFVPDQNGMIVPHGASMGGLTVNFNSVWPPTPAQAREIAAIIDQEQYRTLQRAAPTQLRG